MTVGIENTVRSSCNMKYIWWRYSKAPFEEWRLVACDNDKCKEVYVIHFVKSYYNQKIGWAGGIVEHYPSGYQGVPHFSTPRHKTRHEAFLFAESSLSISKRVKRSTKPGVEIGGWLYPPMFFKGKS